MNSQSKWNDFPQTNNQDNRSPYSKDNNYENSGFTKISEAKKEIGVKNLKYSYPDQLETTNVVLSPKNPRDKPGRCSDDVFMGGSRPQERTPVNTNISNKEAPIVKEMKQPREDKSPQYNDKSPQYQDKKNLKNNEQVGSISEIIDPNKVKTSKLFQKFLQIENKENPTKSNTQREIVNQNKSDISPSRQDKNESNKAKNVKFAPSTYQGPKQQSKGQSNQSYQLKERNAPSYNTLDDSGRNSKNSPPSTKNNQSPKQAFRQNQDLLEDEFESRNLGINLNYQSSSKLVSLQNQDLFPQSLSGLDSLPQTTSFIPNPYSYMEFGGSMEEAKAQNQNKNFPSNSSSNELTMLRAQIMELGQALNREVESKKAIENRCLEYQNQLEQSTRNSQVLELKRKSQDQSVEIQEELRKLEDKVRNLNAIITEKEKTEEQHVAEINKLKRKLDAELESRGRLLEEHDHLERSKYEEAERMNKEIQQKDEEIQRLRRESDSNKYDKDNIRSLEERLTKEIKALRSEIMDLNRTNEDLRKTCDDQHQQITLGTLENNSLRDQLDTMENQYRNLLADNDRIKRDNFNGKERLLAAESQIKTLQLNLEKAQIELDHTHEALTRTEKALERERRLTAELRMQLSLEARNNQRESSMKRELNTNHYEENEEQPYYLKRNRITEKANEDTYQPHPTIYERKRESFPLNYTQHQEEDYSYNQKRNKEDSGRLFKRSIYDQDNMRDHYQKDTAKFEKKEDPYSTRAGRKSATEGNLNPISHIGDDKYEDRYTRARDSSKINTGTRSFGQADYEQKTNKIFSQNTGNKTNYNVLTWEDESGGNKTWNDRTRDRQSPPRGRSQLRSENEEKPNINPKRQNNQTVSVVDQLIRDDKPPQDQQKVKNLESELMSLQMQKDNLNNELQKLDKVKIKSAATIKKKQDIESEMSLVLNNISHVKTKLREMNALHI